MMVCAYTSLHELGAIHPPTLQYLGKFIVCICIVDAGTPGTSYESMVKGVNSREAKEWRARNRKVENRRSDLSPPFAGK
jgi:hypothetical protein